MKKRMVSGVKMLTRHFLCFFSLVVVEVASVQEFMEEPSNAFAVEGNTVVLKCKVRNRAGTLQWTRDQFALGKDRSLPGFDRYTMIGGTEYVGTDKIEEYHLKIVDIALEDDAEYECQVGASTGMQGIRSTIAKLEVLLPPQRPVIQKGPTLAVTLGEPKNISCLAKNGKPGADITWYKDGLRITENIYSQTVTKGKLQTTTGFVTITAEEKDAGRNIKCSAMNKALTDPYVTTAILDVQYRPKVTMKHNVTTRTIREYDYIRFTCTGQANPYDITWKWYRNNDPVGDGKNRLDIPSVTRKYHGNTIACEGKNDVGSTREERLLDIQFGPRILGEPQHQEVDMHDRAVLTCRAEGNPLPSIIWTRKGSTRPLSSSPTFQIDSVGEGDFGVYVCTATVMGFSDVSTEIYLLKNGPPRIMSETQQYALEGKTAQIECMAISSPKPEKMEWMRDGEPIDYSGSGHFSAVEEDLPYGRKSTLQILNVRLEDFGDFNCSVGNRYGKDVTTITLIQKEILPLPYIIGGAVGGIAVLVIVVLACVLYHRYKHSDTESYTDTDSSTEIKKQRDSPSDFAKSTLMDQWRQDYNYRYSADYDDVYSQKDPKGNNNGYGSFISDRQSPSELQNGHVVVDYAYRTDEVVPSERFENSYNTGYVPSTFRSGSRTDFIKNDYNEAYRLPPAEPTTAKLATNV